MRTIAAGWLLAAPERAVHLVPCGSVSRLGNALDWKIVKTHLYTISWNEAEMLPFFFRHFDPWVDRYFIFDDGSTDGTLEILRDHPRVDLRRFERTHADSFVASHQKMQNRAWKESKKEADWVVVTAIDEHLHVPGVPMRDYLERCRRKGVTLLHAMGFQMLSEEFPDDGELLCETRTIGAPYARMSKLSIFDPKSIKNTGFEAGRHFAYPKGVLKLPRRDDLLLLHYKNLGFERVFQRHRTLKSGLGPTDTAQRWAKKYDWSREQLRKDWDLFASAAVDIAAKGFNARKCHRNRRWWRRGWKLRTKLGLVSTDLLFHPRLPGERWAG